MTAVRWTKTLVLAAVMAVLSNAQCLDSCATVRETAKSSVPACPLHQPVGGGCGQLHAQLAIADAAHTTPLFQSAPDMRAGVVGAVAELALPMPSLLLPGGRPPLLFGYGGAFRILRL
jgi:hypothetical protein